MVHCEYFFPAHAQLPLLTKPHGALAIDQLNSMSAMAIGLPNRLPSKTTGVDHDQFVRAVRAEPLNPAGGTTVSDRAASASTLRAVSRAAGTFAVPFPASGSEATAVVGSEPARRSCRAFLASAWIPTHFLKRTEGGGAKYRLKRQNPEAVKPRGFVLGFVISA